MKTDLFQSCGHCWVFKNCRHIECSILTASSFTIWNSSAGIPLPPLALFIVMLPQAHLTLHSWMSGSRWVTTPLWLSGSLRLFKYSSVYSCHFYKRNANQNYEVSPHTSQNGHHQSLQSMLERVWRNVTLMYHWWECKLIIATMQNSVRFLKATKWPSNLITGHISGENHNSKRHKHPNIHGSTIYKPWKQPRCPFELEW